MFCRECGHEINDKAAFCVHCGVPTKDTPSITGNHTIVNVGPTSSGNESTYAKAALWLGIFSLLCGITGPFALIFGIMGISEIRQHPEKTGMGGAIFGTIAGSLSCLCILFAIMGSTNS